jgi:hypothetical protein
MSATDTHALCRRLHDDAMAACDDQDFTRAMELEEQAAVAAGDSEPSRAILYRSAACCAMSAGRAADAERLALLGLEGVGVPSCVLHELQDVLAAARRHTDAGQHPSRRS